LAVIGHSICTQLCKTDNKKCGHQQCCDLYTLFNRLGEGRIVITNFKLLIYVVNFFQYSKLMKVY